MSLYMVGNDSNRSDEVIFSFEGGDDKAMLFCELQLFSPECKERFFSTIKGNYLITLMRLEPHEEERLVGFLDEPGKRVEIKNNISKYEKIVIARWETSSIREDIITRRVEGQNDNVIYRKREGMEYDNWD